MFCIDGSPAWLFSVVRLSLTTDLKMLENALLSYVIEMLAPKQQIDLLPALATCPDWETKVDIFLKHVPENIKHSKRYQRALVKVIYGRLQAIMNYSTADFKKLKSPAILLRAKDLPAGLVIDEDYALQAFLEQPVKVHLLEGNHISIVDNKDCANIINRAMLDLVKEAAAKATGEILNTIDSSVSA